jgi:acetylglutamate kinase
MKQQTLTMQDALNTAKMLSEALPYLQRYADSVVVVKFGGNAMGDDAAMAEFARDIVLMRQVGVNPVVVHGGGPMINDMLNKLGIKSEFVRGKRVTDKATVQVVEMILSGLVNKRIVQAIMDAGGRAVGISGKDDDLMVCEADDPELGFVGRPVEMNVQVLRDLNAAGIIPVVAPVATGMDMLETFNVNGDTAAGAIAGALKADRLLLLTDVPGIKDASGEVVTQLTPDQVRAMIADGTISGGMIPKAETALMAVEQGVRAVVILDGRLPNASLLELFTEHGAGSIIREPR